MGIGELNARGRKPCDGQASHPGGVEILLASSCYRRRFKLRPDGSFGSYAELTYTLPHCIIDDKQSFCLATVVLLMVLLLTV